MTRFILDAQLSRRLVRHLASAGHDASHAFDHVSPEADDRDIAKLANRLEASVMSKDADFADMAKRGLLDRTFVWIRVRNLSDDLLWLRVSQALPSIETAVASNQLIIEVL